MSRLRVCVCASFRFHLLVMAGLPYSLLCLCSEVFESMTAPTIATWTLSHWGHWEVLLSGFTHVHPNIPISGSLLYLVPPPRHSSMKSLGSKRVPLFLVISVPTLKRVSLKKDQPNSFGVAGLMFMQANPKDSIRQALNRDSTSQCELGFTR